GQVEAYASLRGPAVGSKEADFYVVLEGSTLTHVTEARRGSGGGGDIDDDSCCCLWFTIPGHNIVEVVSVSSYYSCGRDGGVWPCGSPAALEYVSDEAQEVAGYLEANRRRLEPGSYLEAQRLCNPRETLLHLAVRQDLLHLSRFLLHRPKGHRALTLPNHPLAPGMSGHDVGGLCLWSDSSGVLRCHPGTDRLTLSAPRLPGQGPPDLIAALRLKRKDPVVIQTVRRRGFITSLGGGDRGAADKEQVDQSGGDLREDPGVVRHGLADDSSVPEDASSQRIRGVTTDSSATDSTPRSATDTPPPKHHPHPHPHHQQQHPPPPPSTPPAPPLLSSPLTVPTPPLSADHSSNRSTPEDLKNRRASSPALGVEDLSPSLVALEMDSEEDSVIVPRSCPGSEPPSAVQSGVDPFDPSPDLTCTRTKSASSACDSASSQESCEPGVRLRSYSYSSKLSLRPSRTGSRDAPPPGTSPPASSCEAEAEVQVSGSRPSGRGRRTSGEVRLRKRAQSADDEGDTGLTESLQHLTLSEFLKEIEEEEFDKYNIPSKTDSDKYKVIRTFSFLKSRMSSTRNKSKGKAKDREAKDRHLNGHQFATGSCLGPTVCLICEKPASGRDLLHCSRCMSMVHKGCKDSVPPCLKKPQDKYAISMVKNRTSSLPQNFTTRDTPPHPSTMSLPVISPKEKKEGALLFNPFSGAFSNTSDRQNESSEAESDNWRIFNQSDELQQTVVSSTDSSIGEDCVDSSYVSADLAAGALEFEAESWSLSVEQQFCERQDKQEVKRQDVIYELMQTEVHHLQTLHIMAEVFRRGVRKDVQLDAEAQERLFPCLDQLLALHHAFFCSMRERRRLGSAAGTPGEQRGYLIQRMGDLLLHQFTEENAERMKQVYGEFCSHHNDAVSFFKELQQNNKRFQTFVKQQSLNSLVRRREIPECILLVTQRITKYPVLLERILKYTQEATQEHADLLEALVRIREVVAAVDLRVSEYEQDQRLRDVWNRMENRSAAKLKNGHVFRKQDMMNVMALLLPDTLIFLQEKDQKYMFAAVDQKPPVISLQKLIVREVANEERGVFLISASAAGPEMYEVHASSAEERNTWMRLIREAVESCPEEEEDYTSESEDEKRAAEARLQKIHKLQESLMNRDQQICSSLEEKLQIYAESFALRWTTDASQLESRIRARPHSDEVPQGAVLLAAAVQETENLKAMLASPAASSLCSSPIQEDGKDGNTNNDIIKVAQSVQSLTQLLYSLQRWEKECVVRQGQQGALEARLDERERLCRLRTERLRGERRELDERLAEYQRSLERLRDGQRGVERERHALDTRQRLLRGWKHGRQRSLPSMGPSMVIPLGEKQVSDYGGHGGSVFRSDPGALDSLNALLVRSNQRQQAAPPTRPLEAHTQFQGWAANAGFFYSPVEAAGKLSVVLDGS
ncbi:hypothetical protein NHX12_026811, partial [Muraenolepis orangiensis]